VANWGQAMLPGPSNKGGTTATQTIEEEEEKWLENLS
jgi:hypothetical protein